MASIPRRNGSSCPFQVQMGINCLLGLTWEAEVTWDPWQVISSLEQLGQTMMKLMAIHCWLVRLTLVQTLQVVVPFMAKKQFQLVKLEELKPMRCAVSQVAVPKSSPLQDLKSLLGLAQVRLMAPASMLGICSTTKQQTVILQVVTPLISTEIINLSSGSASTVQQELQQAKTDFTSTVASEQRTRGDCR